MCASDVLPSPGGPQKEKMLQRILARLRRADEHVEPFLDPRLPNKLVQQRGTKRHLQLADPAGMSASSGGFSLTG